jgi:cyanophycin synthetase
VVEYSEEVVGRLALDLAAALCDSARQSSPFDLEAALHQLRDLDEDVRLGPSTGSVVSAAMARGIPYSRMTEGSMVRFGWGRKQRRIQAAEIDATSAIAEAIAQDKELTKKLLHAAGVPVPHGRAVGDADDAWQAALEIGLPVVVKPLDGNQGKGVHGQHSGRSRFARGLCGRGRLSGSGTGRACMPATAFRLLVVGDRAGGQPPGRDPPTVAG